MPEMREAMWRAAGAWQRHYIFVGAVAFHPAQTRFKTGGVSLLGADLCDGSTEGVGLADAVHLFGPGVEIGDA